MLTMKYKLENLQIMTCRPSSLGQPTSKQPAYLDGESEDVVLHRSDERSVAMQLLDLLVALEIETCSYYERDKFRLAD